MDTSKPKCVLKRDILLCLMLASISTGIGFVVSGNSAEPVAERSSHEAPADTKIAGTVGMISFEDVLGKRGILLDTRADLFYRNGHIPGALSLSAVRFQACYAKLKPRLEADKDQPIILYCEGSQCGASEQVANHLLALGYTCVSIFKEGWTAWKQAELPQEKSEGSDTRLAPWKQRNS